MTRRRLDAELVRRGLASSRTAAQQLIADGRVTVSGMAAGKAATQVEDSAPVEVAPSAEEEWVSRGAHKLLGALEAFEALLPSLDGIRALDAGASTGGFTDVLLRRGAASVVAVDVGYGQLAWRLREDPRVVVMERTNVRNLTPQAAAVGGEAPSLVVSDLSFISLTKVIPALLRAAPEALQLLMVKPQFEVGKGRVGAGGVVRDANLRVQAVADVAAAAVEAGLRVVAVAPSPLPGPAGNVEYFLLLSPAGTHLDLPGLEGPELQESIRHAVASGPQDGLTLRPGGAGDSGGGNWDK